MRRRSGHCAGDCAFASTGGSRLSFICALFFNEFQIHSQQILFCYFVKVGSAIAPFTAPSMCAPSLFHATHTTQHTTQSAEEHDKFFRQLEGAQNRFGVIADYFGKPLTPNRKVLAFPFLALFLFYIYMYISHLFKGANR